MTRQAATRFTFFLALPALVGATAVSLPDLNDQNAAFSLPAIGAGVAAAFASGYVAIGSLLRVVARDRLTPFAIYCVLAGTAALVALTATS